MADCGVDVTLAKVLAVFEAQMGGRGAGRLRQTYALACEGRLEYTEDLEYPDDLAYRDDGGEERQDGGDADRALLDTVGRVSGGR